MLRAHALSSMPRLSWGSADDDCLSALGEAQARHLGRWPATDCAGTDTSSRLLQHGVEMRKCWMVIEVALAVAGRILPATQVDVG